MSDYTRIGPHLYQGGVTALTALGGYPYGNAPTGGFQVLVLCAEELQFLEEPREQPPYASMRNPPYIHRCPLNDDGETPMSQLEWERAWETGGRVRDHILAGRRCLVTCAQGKNRSGLVVAIACHMLTKESGDKCVEHVRKMRPGSLTNQWFVDALRRLK